MNTGLSTCPRFSALENRKESPLVSNLTPRILALVARLSGRKEPEPTSLPAPTMSDPPAMEAAYRQALRRWFELTAQGPGADLAEVRRVHQEILRLIDEVGEPTATTLRRQWARAWHQETGICPYCGERGPYHDPDRGRGANQ